MVTWASKQKGFTIVELLIVIVVIGILAAITLVAYNGIQTRAKVTAMQSDLSNTRKKLMAYGIEKGAYPVSSAELAAVGLRMSGVSNYDIRPSYNNFYYCADTAGTNFAVGVRAANNPSTSHFITNSSDSRQDTAMITQNSTCAKIGLPGSDSASGAYSTGGISAAGVVSPWLGN